MTKIAFKDYVPRVNGKRSVEEAIAELQREMDVRKKIYDRWVADQRMSWMDAHDRMERLQSALHHLIQYNKQLDSQEQALVNNNIHQLPDPSVNSLDDAPASATA